MNVRMYLKLFVALPILGLIVVSALAFISSKAALDNAAYSKSVVSSVGPIAEFVHQLQVERAMSAIQISSEGSSFESELPKQRAASDAAMEMVLAAVSDKSAEYGGAINAVRGAYTKVVKLRTRVDGLQASVSEVTSTYTGVIRAGIKLNESLVAHFEDGATARLGAGLVAIAEAKEAAALERAMGAIGFDAGEFTPSVLQRFGQFRSVQNVTLDIFEQYAKTFGLDIDVQALPESGALTTMRDVAFSGNAQSIGQISSTTWFAKSTEWIDRLRALETDVIERVNTVSLQAITRAWSDLILNAVSSSLALLASVIGGMFVTRKFVRGFSALGEATEKIARKEFDAEINVNAKVKEIDALGAALTEMRDTLAASDLKLQSAFSKSFAFDDSDSAMVVVAPDLTVMSANTSAIKLFAEKSADFSTVLENLDPHNPEGGSVVGLIGSHSEMSAFMSDASKLPWRDDVSVGDLKLELNVSMVQKEDGSYAGNVIEARDVTQERLHAGMIAVMQRDHGVAEFKLDGSLVSANENFANMVGVAAEHFAQSTYQDLLGKSDEAAQELAQAWPKLVNGETYSTRLAVLNKAGETVWIRAGFTPVLDKSNHPFKISLIAEDITEAVETARRNQEEAAKSAQAREVVVTSLATGLQSLSNGDLTHRIEIFFEEEYKTLRMDFNQAASAMAAAMAKVTQSANQLNMTSEELSSASRELAERTERQAARLSDTAVSLDNVTATVQKTASQAQDAEEAVKTASTDAEINESTVKDAMNVMDLIASSSNEISSITTLIDDISFQTNLLALNAGVEAARAGEAGRGFAVVASEVRALAQRAAGAANEINGLISKSREHVDNGVGLVASVGKSLTEISHQISVASSSVQNIRVATEQQATMLNAVNSSVSDIGDLTQQNAAMGEESSALSETLRKDANLLTKTVESFRVPELEIVPGGSDIRVA